MIDPQDYPLVPNTQRPKPFYVMENLTSDVVGTLTSMGWQVMDVRLIDARADRVKATFEGISVGTITISKDVYRFLETEARMEKLLLNKESFSTGDDDTYLDKSDIDSILNFGGPVKLPLKENTAVAPDSNKPRRGRPPSTQKKIIE